MLYNLLPNALQYLLASYVLPSGLVLPPKPRTLSFGLRHEYGLSNSSRPVFANVPVQFAPEAFTLDTKDVKTYRPQSQRVLMSARMRSSGSDLLVWDEDEITGPNVNDKNTLLMLAKMTANAYYKNPAEKGWYDLGPDWNSVSPAVLSSGCGIDTCAELSVWMGTGRRRIPWTRLRYSGQLYGRCLDQRNIRRMDGRWWWANAEERQA